MLHAFASSHPLPPVLCLGLSSQAKKLEDTMREEMQRFNSHLVKAIDVLKVAALHHDEVIGYLAKQALVMLWQSGITSVVPQLEFKTCCRFEEGN